MITIGIVATYIAPRAHATSTAGFQAGSIISDGVFTNYQAMSVDQIQSFLNSKVPTCDTNGTQSAADWGYPNLTHAQFATQVMGWPAPPYPCLKDYVENNISAAQLIYNLSQQYQINPQVLIVTLQKESSLVTDTWPLPSQYRTATGYGCPDSGPNNSANCNASYYGLTNQLTNTAYMYRAVISKNPNWYSPYVVGTNYIQWNPASSCGGSNVTITNLSTAALYDYTPYQPNQAALDAGYGGGVNCGAYGNRNFWLYFNDWFGPTYKVVIPGCTAATNTSLSCAWKVKNNTTGQETISTSYAEVDNLVNNQPGYSYVGVAFLVRNPITPSSGNIPIYSVTVNSVPLLTADYAEYSSLVSAGNQANGIAFYADPANSNSGYSVYRLNSATYGHVWTSDMNEVSTYVAQGYTNEGIVFTALSPVVQETAPQAGKSLVYRFRNMPSNTHFWTSDVYERDQMIRAGYTYDGIGWQGSQTQTSTPIYRMYAPSLQQHLFTSSWNEVSTLSSKGWNYEGVVMYATQSGSPVYRLYRPQTGEHLFTSDAYERSVLVQQGTFNDEGVAWYQP